MGYFNPLLKLSAGRALLDLPKSDRQRIEHVMRALRAQANEEAEKAYRRRKGPMHAYWRAVATYSRHIAHALSRDDRPSDCQSVGADVSAHKNSRRTRSPSGSGPGALL